MTGGAAAANAARVAAAQTPGGGGFGQIGPLGPPGNGIQAPAQIAQGDASAPVSPSDRPSYAENLATPPPSNPMGRSAGQGASAPIPVNGTNDPTLNGLVPRGLVAKFQAEGVPPEQWAGAAVAYLTSAAGRVGTPPASAEAWRQLAGEIGQTLRLRSTPNPALKEIDAERQTDPTTGQPETNSQVIARIAQTKAAAEAQGKAGVEAGTASQIAEQESAGKALGELPGKLADTANAAKLQNSMLDEMQSAASNFRMGWGADTQQHAVSMLQGLGQMLGIDTTGIDKQVGSYQDFVKLSGGFLRQAAHETSSRVGVQEMQLISRSLPSPEMSPDGFGLIAPQIKAINDMSVAKQQAGQAWADSHNHSYAGFESDWNKNTSPAAFVFHRMAAENPQAFQTMVSNMSATPGGKAAMKHIRDEVTWANSNGLFGG